jgi:hypothetical protein
MFLGDYELKAPDINGSKAPERHGIASRPALLLTEKHIMASPLALPA